MALSKFPSLGPSAQICTLLNSGATQVWDAPQDVPYAYKGNEWVGYDNIKSFNIKVRWGCGCTNHTPGALLQKQLLD